MSWDDNQKFSMEMLFVGTEVDDDGKVEPIYSVQFITPNGIFRYPWKHLKETCLNWIDVEKGMKV